MEKEYIYEASSVEEALQKGLKDLALSEDKVKIDVIEGGSAGIFGLFKKEAKVKLTPLDSEFIKEEKQEEVKEVKVEEPVEKKQEEKVVEIETVKEEVVVENEEAVEEKTQEVIEKKEKREDYIVKNKDSIVSYLQNIVIAMGYADATVDFTEDGNRHFTLNIKTEENTSLIIGKRGVTLNSLQFLVNNYAKKFSSHFFRIEVDCDDYRESRKKTLEELALNLAKKSKKIGKPVELEPMTSVERKIIHNALTGIKNVETESRGEEPYRYLVITAK
ncbi:R3H domain-containing protein [Gemella morbillorum M424]|uniref:RNA-binding protein KhpB n=1 Tax=Gemella morbillorum TaxID=29391 RepID=A0AAP9HDS4_9BACL|nr:RNA-binding cell elongation regulator Jag/EloR [Gemella morbillorum]EFV34777.1 R3H domain-containing protein [Gemella morbillorum M424]QGS09106.1 KH domain-containing protein [Gemella morbillorum]